MAPAFSITFNWNPSYSYAKMPDDVKNPPAYWRVLTEAVAAEKGLPHLRNVRISDVKALSGGTIQNAKGWSLENLHIESPTPVVVKDSTDIGAIKY